MKIKVTLKDYYDPTMPWRTPEIFETNCYNVKDGIEQYCFQHRID